MFAYQNLVHSMPNQSHIELFVSDKQKEGTSLAAILCKIRHVPIDERCCQVQLLPNIDNITYIQRQSGVYKKLHCCDGKNVLPNIPLCFLFVVV